MMVSTDALVPGRSIKRHKINLYNIWPRLVGAYCHARQESERNVLKQRLGSETQTKTIKLTSVL